MQAIVWLSFSLSPVLLCVRLTFIDNCCQQTFWLFFTCISVIVLMEHVRQYFVSFQLIVRRWPDWYNKSKWISLHCMSRVNQMCNCCFLVSHWPTCGYSQSTLTVVSEHFVRSLNFLISSLILNFFQWFVTQLFKHLAVSLWASVSFIDCTSRLLGIPV